MSNQFHQDPPPSPPSLEASFAQRPGSHRPLSRARAWFRHGGKDQQIVGWISLKDVGDFHIELIDVLRLEDQKSFWSENGWISGCSVCFTHISISVDKKVKIWKDAVHTLHHVHDELVFTLKIFWPWLVLASRLRRKLASHCIIQDISCATCSHCLFGTVLVIERESQACGRRTPDVRKRAGTPSVAQHGQDLRWMK